MQPSHVIAFVDFKIDDLQKKYADSLTKYNDSVAEYKAMPFYKRLFALNPEHGYWSWRMGDYWIDELKAIRREAEYKNKMEQMQTVYIPMNIPEDWQKPFYKWAEDNKIPF